MCVRARIPDITGGFVWFCARGATVSIARRGGRGRAAAAAGSIACVASQGDVSQRARLAQYGRESERSGPAKSSARDLSEEKFGTSREIHVCAIPDASLAKSTIHYPAITYKFNAIPWH
jgi:hypothetical protein